ncbi:MAG: DUF1641 domain-containing protein [Desulfobacterales bacterium]|nr:DUF1641 domain-containing protein [Desulfobacterales bacterium]
MDESLILAKLDELSAEIKSLKSGVLDELKSDLQPVVQLASPHVMNFLADVEGEYSNEELAALLKNIMLNIKNLNTMLDMLKAGMELKDDMGPVVKQGLPKLTEFMAELDGQFDGQELVALMRKTLSNLDNFNSALDMLKAGMELKDDMGPVVKQGLPKLTEFMAELDGQFDGQELVALMRKTLSNLDNFNSALDMLKAGMELKDDMGPVVKQGWPKVMSFMADLHEGEFKAEHLEDLLRQFLLNVQTFSELMSLIKPATELVDEVGGIMRQYDVFSKLSRFLYELEQRGFFRVLSSLGEVVKEFHCSPTQMEMICEAVKDIELGKPSYVGPFDMVNEIRDPNVQETLGAAFKIMRAVGCCLRANRLRQVAEDYPEEFPGMTVGN